MFRFGIQKTTLLDFPGKVAATLFFAGCNMRCPYCHNGDLARGILEEEGAFTLEDLVLFLQKRHKVLGGVCITGGEPLLSPYLNEVIDIIHRFNLEVKLDTNGSIPSKLRDVKVEYIAMDIKTSPKRYTELGLKIEDISKLTDSIDYIMTSGIAYEFRTTAAPEILSIEDMKIISQLIKGAPSYFITPFRPGNVLDKSWKDVESPSKEYMESLIETAHKNGLNAQLR